MTPRTCSSLAGMLVCMVAACAGGGSRPAPVTGPPSAAEGPVAKESGEPGAAAGTTREAALEVCGPAGQREYLSHLRCADGQAPRFERIGSVGSRLDLLPGEPEPSFEASMDMNRPLAPGERDHHIVDAYAVTCSDGERELFLDMYHCAQPAPVTAPPGFTYVP